MRRNWQDKPGVPGPEAIAEYYAMITAVDDQVGRLMNALKELGVAEDTIILFSSDHGDMLGSQGRRLKRKPWEESIGIPGVLRYPSRVRPARSEAFFTHVDFAPTLLGLCGVKVPAAMQGTDFSPTALGRRQKAPDRAFFQIFGPFQGDGTEDAWRGVRTRRYMYARFESQPWVLYDLQADPWQMNNLAGDRGARAVQEEMERRLRQCMEQTADSWSYNWKALVEDRGRLYRHRAFYTVQEYLDWAKQHPELDIGR
jgi:arylsulfatase A-like enzyme